MEYSHLYYPPKSGKWLLIHDLRAINAQMQPMGSLQPGILNPSLIPEDHAIIIIDLKDCFFFFFFFTIFLLLEDKQKFAFSVPNINNHCPLQ